MVEGEIGGTAPLVRRARVFQVEPGWQVHLRRSGFLRPHEAILVVSSRRSVCRELELPMASDEDMQRLLSLRLETELPYASSETAWTWQRQDSPGQSGTARVLFVAVPNADIAVAEQELQASGQPCHVLECREAALAQVAAVQAPDVETAVIVEIETEGSLLAVARDGKLSYARYLAGGAAEPGSAVSADEDVSRLAGELDQTLHHYMFRTNAPAPDKLLMVGEPDKIARTSAAFEERTGLTVEIPRPPEWLRFAGTAAEREKIFRCFTPCIGALITAHHRLRGEQSAAPPLRMFRPRLREPALYRRVGLAAMNVLLVIALIAAGFGVRSARLRAANRGVREAQSLRQGVELLEEEVEILRTESERQRPALDLLLALAEALPEGVTISELTIDSRDNVTIRGKAPSAEVALQAANALSTSRKFANAELKETKKGEKKEEKGVMFRINCVVRMKGA